MTADVTTDMTTGTTASAPRPADAYRRGDVRTYPDGSNPNPAIRLERDRGEHAVNALRIIHARPSPLGTFDGGRSRC